MARTRKRPLPAGRLGSAEVLISSALAIVAGVVWLAWSVNALTALWGLLTWFLYVAVYTPMKPRTWMNTGVGAISGALPLLMGWSAAGAPLDLRIASLFTLMFLWQFPHFMAIAWLYREDYRRAGFQMLSVVDPTGRRAGVQALSAATALLPVSVLPVLFTPSRGAALYAVVTLSLGLMQWGYSAWFFMQRDEASARQLLRASLIYLPAVLFMLALVPLV